MKTLFAFLIKGIFFDDTLDFELSSADENCVALHKRNTNDYMQRCFVNTTVAIPNDPDPHNDSKS